jgi:acetyl-CoA carboxylase alpha subunit
MSIRLPLLAVIAGLLVGCAKNSDVAKLRAQVVQLQRQQGITEVDLRQKIDDLDSKLAGIEKEYTDKLSTLDRTKVDTEFARPLLEDIKSLQGDMAESRKEELKENLDMRVLGLEETSAKGLDVIKLEERILNLEETVFGQGEPVYRLFGRRSIGQSLQERINNLESRLQGSDLPARTP